VRISADWYF